MMLRYLMLVLLAVVVWAGANGWNTPVVADGFLVKKKPSPAYGDSLVEKMQEAIIVFQAGDKPGEALEDLIIKIRVEGDVTEFGWVLPFPNPPEYFEEDPALFEELYRYVQAKQPPALSKSADTKSEEARPLAGAAVEVISRKVVGVYDVAVLKENVAGGLTAWLEEHDFQTLPEKAGPLLDFYREKNYCFACIKVSAQALKEEKQVDLHPLRFRFNTQGRDGIYFPMKLSGLLEQPFDVNLYVFYRFWLNEKTNRFGFRHRGFELVYKDYDTSACDPSGGKSWSDPGNDPFLQSAAPLIPKVTRLFQKLHPGEKYYLTNIRANKLVPKDVYAWPDDLWLFPNYTDRKFVPYDAMRGGPAEAAFPQPPAPFRHNLSTPLPVYLALSGFLVGGGILALGLYLGWLRAKRLRANGEA